MGYLRIGGRVDRGNSACCCAAEALCVLCVDARAIGLLLLICGCQSWSTLEPLPPRVVTVGAGTRGVVDGALRARLDPAHARRIIAITDEGDRAVIALKACQGSGEKYLLGALDKLR